MQDRQETDATEFTDTDTNNLPVPEEVRWLIYQHLPFFKLPQARLVSRSFNQSVLAYSKHITSPKMVVEYLSDINTADGQAFLEYYHHSRPNNKPLDEMSPMQVFAFTMTRREHAPELIGVLNQAMQSKEYDSLSELAKQHLSISLAVLKLTQLGRFSSPNEREALANEMLTLLQAFIKCKQASFINLAGIDLWGVKLTKMNLRGVYMPGAKLQNVQLDEADLSEANLNGADCHGARLLGTKLDKTNLVAAQMSGIYTNVGLHQTSATDFSCSIMLDIRITDNIQGMIANLNAQLNPYIDQMADTLSASKRAVLTGLASNVQTLANQITDVNHRLNFIDAAINHRAFLEKPWDRYASPEAGSPLERLIILKEQVQAAQNDSVEERSGLKNK